VSYDISLCKTIDGVDHHVHDVGNYTSNVSAMWRSALGGRDLGELCDATEQAGGLVPLLDTAIDGMRADPAAYRAMNPANGWGCYEGALEYLQRLRLGCRLHPDAKVYVSR
jgi:hypothetical protein